MTIAKIREKRQQIEEKRQQIAAEEVAAMTDRDGFDPRTGMVPNFTTEQQLARHRVRLVPSMPRAAGWLWGAGAASRKPANPSSMPVDAPPIRQVDQ